MCSIGGNSMMDDPMRSLKPKKKERKKKTSFRLHCDGYIEDNISSVREWHVNGGPYELN